MNGTSIYNKVKLIILCLFLIPIAFSPEYSSTAQSETYQFIPITQTKEGVWSNGNSFSPSISSDGRFIAFVSEASDLINGDTNNVSDVFVYDTLAHILRRISINESGEQANAPSLEAIISPNGRFVLFESLANNLVPQDKDGTSDFFLFDQVTQKLSLIYLGAYNKKPNSRIERVSMSKDGRYLLFTTTASNIVLGDNNNAVDCFLYDTFSKTATRFPLPDIGSEEDQILDARLSLDGNIAFLLTINNQDNIQKIHLFQYQRVLRKIDLVKEKILPENTNHLTGNIEISRNGKIISVLINEKNIVDNQSTTLDYFVFTPENNNSISILGDSPIIENQINGNGNLAIAIEHISDEENALVVTDLNDYTKTMVDTNISAIQPSSSVDGNMIVFSSMRQGKSQLIVAQKPNAQTEKFIIQGLVLNQNVSPLGLVSIKDSYGNQTRTDPDGYFYLNGYSNGSLTLEISKEGYKLLPSTMQLNISHDVTGLMIQATPDSVLEEARLDIGMPYGYDRGCNSPFKGCGGLFHGFNSGYCTDLILDAFTWGADFNIELALEHDAELHPDHFYRWRNARNANDMWRFFAYTDQLLSNNEGYLPGDIVFFDWSGDGEIDHVSLISEVTSSLRPKTLLDATGITKSNPSGLTAELPWESFHQKTTRGHARWNGLYIPNDPAPKNNATTLQSALSSQNASLILLDSEERQITDQEDTADNIQSHSLVWESSINIIDPLKIDPYFSIQVINTDQNKSFTPYILTIQIIHNGFYVDRLEYRGEIKPKGKLTFPIFLHENEEGTLSLIPMHLNQIRKNAKK